MKTLDAPIGARIPKRLKKKLDAFCHEHGLKMSHVVTTALEDKLGELEEELDDRAWARERLKDAKGTKNERVRSRNLTLEWKHS